MCKCYWRGAVSDVAYKGSDTADPVELDGAAGGGGIARFLVRKGATASAATGGGASAGGAPAAPAPAAAGSARIVAGGGGGGDGGVRTRVPGSDSDVEVLDDSAAAPGAETPSAVATARANSAAAVAAAPTTVAPTDGGNGGMHSRIDGGNGDMDSRITDDAVEVLDAPEACPGCGAAFSDVHALIAHAGTRGCDIGPRVPRKRRRAL